MVETYLKLDFRQLAGPKFYDASFRGNVSYKSATKRFVKLFAHVSSEPGIHHFAHYDK